MSCRGWTIGLGLWFASLPGGAVALNPPGAPLPPAAVARLGTTHLRHEHTVLTLAFSPDGRRLASAANDFTARLWDTATGSELHRFGPAPSERLDAAAARRAVGAVAFRPDGRTVAVGSGDGGLSLYDADTGREVRKLPGHQGAVRAVAFTHDGKTLAVAGDEQVIRFWDPDAGRVRHTVHDAGEVTSLAFSPDGGLLVVGSADGKVRLWRTASGTLLRRAEADAGPVHAVAFAPDGRRVASAGHDGTIRLWDMTVARSPQVLPHALSGVSWGRPGLMPTVQGLLYAALERPLRVLPATAEVFGLAFSPDGNTLASVGADGVIRLWDPATGRAVPPLASGLGPLRAVAFTPDGTTLAVAGERCTISLRDVRGRRPRAAATGHEGSVGAVVFTAVPAGLVTAAADRSVRLWDLRSQAETRRLARPVGSVHAIAVAPDQRIAWVGGADGVLRRWDLASGAETRAWPAHRGAVTAVALAPGSGPLATAGQDGGIMLWDAATGVRRAELKGHDRSVKVLAFSPDGRRLAATTGGDTVVLWEPATGQRVRELTESGCDVLSLAFVPDASVLATGGPDGVLRLWDPVAGRVVRQLTGMSGAVRAVAYSPDGRTLAAGSWQTLTLLEADTGLQRARLTGLPGDVLALEFSTDGRSLATGHGDTTALVWNVAALTEGCPVRAPSVRPDLDGEWAALAGGDAARAYRAVWRLAAAPDVVVPFLSARLRPVPVPDASARTRMTQLLADLGQDEFAMRTRASKELESLGELAEPALRQALAASADDEVRGRLQMLLHKLQAPPAAQERLRALRACEVLELVGTAPARQVLQALAAGQPEARLTLQARAALGRLELRAAANAGPGNSGSRH